MKNRITTIAIASIIVGTILSSCQSSEKKVENAKENIVEAKQELNQIVKDSIIQFRTESAIKIADQEKSIADFRKRIAKDKKANREKYETKLADLEQKNTDLKKRLDDYKEESQEQWNSFKFGFNKDMDALGEAFKDLGSKDKK
jgi:predicted metal-dependent hydrolase